MASERVFAKIVPFPAVRPLRKKKRRLPIAIVALGLLVTMIAYSFLSQEMELRGLRQRADELKAVQAALEQQTIELRAEIELLNTPEYIAHLARQRLGLLKSNDGIFLPVIVPPNQ